MTTKQQQIQNSFVYLIPAIVGSLLPLITLPIFTRILTPEDYGVLALAMVYSTFVAGLTDFGMRFSYERNFFEHRGGKEESYLFYSTLAFVLALFAVFGTATWVFRAQFAQLVVGSSRYGDLIFLTFCATGTQGLKVYFLTYFRNTGNAKQYAIHVVAESALWALFSLVFVGVLRIGVAGLPLGQLLASLVVLTLLAARFLRELPLGFNRGILVQSLKISYPLAPRVVLAVVAKQLDKFLIGLFAGLAGVGVYAIGQRVANLVFTYMVSLENVFAPQVYKRMFTLGDRGGEAVGRYLTPFAYSSTAVAMLLSLFSEEMLILLTPPSFHGAVAVVNVLAIYYSISFFGKQPQLLYSKKTHLIPILTAVHLVLILGFSVPFIRAWGAVGAAWGTLTAGTIYLGLWQALGQRHYRIHYEYRKLGAIFGVLVFSSILMLVLREISVEYLIRLFVKGVCIVAYVWLGVWVNVINRSSVHDVRRAFLSMLRIGDVT